MDFSPSCNPVVQAYLFFKIAHVEKIEQKGILTLNRDLCCQIPYTVPDSSIVTFKVSCHNLKYQ